jgi:hypothetical protein
VAQTEGGGTFRCVERATASNLPTDPAPTLRLALFQKSF